MKDPAFLFYTKDFLSGVMGLTFEERGIYITLLCIQHQQGHLSEKVICLSAGIASLASIPDVMAKFTKDDAGLYFNERLEDEANKRADYAESRRKNGLSGGRPKKGKNHMESTEKPYGLHMDKHRESIEKAPQNLPVNGDVSSNYSLEDKVTPREEKKYNKKPERREHLWPWNTQTFKDAWWDWIEYLHEEHEEIYRSNSSERSALMLLQRMPKSISKGEAGAIDTIRYSIASRYKNLYENTAAEPEETPVRRAPVTPYDDKNY